jgi:hypothetical protein
MCTINGRSLGKIDVLLGDNTVRLRQLRDCDCALKHSELAIIKTKGTLRPLRIKERPQRLLLRRIESPTMHSHIRIQHPAHADINQSVNHHGQGCARTWRASPQNQHRTHRPHPRQAHTALEPPAPARSRTVSRARLRRSTSQVRCPPSVGPQLVPRAS